MRLSHLVNVVVLGATMLACDRHDAAVFGSVTIGGGTTNGTVQLLDAERAQAVMRPVCLHYDSVIAPMRRRQLMLAASSEISELQQSIDLLRLLQAQYKALAPQVDSAMARLRVGRAPIATNGHFSISGLPSGHYALLVNTDFGTQSITAWKLIDLGRGSWTRVDIGDRELVTSDPLCPTPADASH